MRFPGTLLAFLALCLLGSCTSTPVPAEAGQGVSGPSAPEPASERSASDGASSDSTQAELSDTTGPENDDEAPPPAVSPDGDETPPDRVTRWLPPERAPAPAVPSAVDRRRLAAFAAGVPLYPSNVVREAIGSGPYERSLVETLVSAEFLEVPPAGSERIGYDLSVTVLGHTQPSIQNYYGRVRVTASVFDRIDGEVIAQTRTNGPWTFSRVSVEDAQLNSLRRLLDDSALEESIRRRLEGSIARGVSYRVAVVGDVPAGSDRLIETVLRGIAHAVVSVRDEYLLKAHVPPDLFVSRLAEAFAGGPFVVERGSLTRALFIGYTEE